MTFPNLYQIDSHCFHSGRDYLHYVVADNLCEATDKYKRSFQSKGEKCPTINKVELVDIVLV